MRYLAPLSRPDMNASARAGEAIFDQTGCSVCHTPILQTGRNVVAALNRKPVPLYSALLLHDMGSLADGIAQEAAGTGEMKTAPLWGMRTQTNLLNVGRAPMATMVIQAHDGELRVARDRFNRLPPPQRQQLLVFLRTL